MPIYTCEADGYRIFHFGLGDLVVHTNEPIERPFPDELIITPSDVTGEIGADASYLFAGKSTAEMPDGIRMIFDSVESIQVVIDALLRLQSARMTYDILQQQEATDNPSG